MRNNTYFIKLDNNNIIRLNLNEILYIQADKDYINIHTYYTTYRKIHRTLISIEISLIRINFPLKRISRSILVNEYNIKHIVKSTNSVVFMNYEVVRISDSYLNIFDFKCINPTKRRINNTLSKTCL